MSGDNGKIETPKTPEQLKQERLKRYQDNPENFVEVSQIITCVIRSSKGNMIMISGSVAELKVVFTDITRHLLKTIDIMEEEIKSKIVIPPKGGIINHARRLN